MDMSFHNGRVLVDGTLREGLTVTIEDGTISAVSPEQDPPNGLRIDLAGDVLAPGFIDTQVNGGGGVLFNDSPSVEAVAAIGAAHRQFGTTGFLPTLISDELHLVERGIRAVDEAIERGVPGVLGIHIEGPFLNVERRGIHRADRIRPLDMEAVELLTQLQRGKTLITLAPETTSPDLVQALVERGAIVAAGHTNASYAEMRQAIDAGLTGATHLFNAMSPLRHREPGAVGAILESDDITAGIIVDGHHVSSAALGIALRARGPQGFMLVTDAMPSVGGPKGFSLQGQPIRVENGACLSACGTLAGSDLDMAKAVSNVVTMLNRPLADALGMAAAVPAAFLGLDRRLGHIRPGASASLVRLDDNMQVVDSWIDGQPA